MSAFKNWPLLSNSDPCPLCCFKEDIVTYLNILKKFCDLTLNQKI